MDTAASTDAEDYSEEINQPCFCGSGKPFIDCCAIVPEENYDNDEMESVILPTAAFAQSYEKNYSDQE